MKPLLRDYAQPWKLLSFAAGLGLLVLGALTLNFPDWDIGVSIVMATLTYLTAGWSVRVCLLQRWSFMPLAAFWAWLAIDGSYWAYHSLVGNQMLRAGQWPLSACMYFFCGLLWAFRGSLRTIIQKVRSHSLTQTISLA